MISPARSAIDHITRDSNLNIRTLIVDDEPPARERLRRFLSEEAHIEIVGQCDSGPAAARAIRSLHPELVFLDIRLPGQDGFAMLQSLGGRLPLFIVVTAHAQHAPRAFETHAVDYLLKPFTRERLREALRKARERLACPALPGLADRLAALRARARPRVVPKPLAFKAGGKVILVHAGDIDCVIAAGDIVEVWIADARHRVTQSLGYWMQRLPSGCFVRINRSMLINVERIKELELRSHGDCTVVLEDGRSLPLTRRYRAGLDRLLDSGGR